MRLCLSIDYRGESNTCPIYNGVAYPLMSIEAISYGAWHTSTVNASTLYRRSKLVSNRRSGTFGIGLVALAGGVSSQDSH